MNFSLERIISSCPAIQGNRATQRELIITTKEPYESNVAKVVCEIPAEQRAPFGCRSVTDLNETGCPLRDSSQLYPIKVILNQEA